MPVSFGQIGTEKLELKHTYGENKGNNSTV